MVSVLLTLLTAGLAILGGLLLSHIAIAVILFILAACSFGAAMFWPEEVGIEY